MSAPLQQLGEASSATAGSLGLSVVLPTRDRRANVVAVVRALLDDDEPDTEVVVVDDGSTDDTWPSLQALAAADPRVVPLRQVGAGKRAANRTAQQRARGRVLLFLDDDVVPGPGLLRGHLLAHAGRDDAVVVGYMPTSVPRRPRGGSFATVLYAQEYEARCRRYEADPARILDHLWMGNVSMTRAAYERAGLVSLEAFPHRHEDRDVGLACSRAGLVGVFDRSLAGTHRHTRDVDSFVRECVQQGAGRAALALRHGELAAFELDDALAGLPRPAALLVGLTRRRWALRLAGGSLEVLLRLAVRWPTAGPALVVARVLRRIKHREGAEALLTAAGPSREPETSR